MTITSNLYHDGVTVVIAIKGRFDYSAHLEFHTEFRRYPKGERSFIVDMQDVDSMDSSAMGMLLHLREYRDKHAGAVQLVNVNELVRETLEIANFHKIFKFS